MRKGYKIPFKRKMPPMSQKHRLAISLANKGHIVTEETKIKIGNANRGRKYGIMPQEHRDKISFALKGRMPKFIPDNTGRKHTPEHTAKWKEARIKKDNFKWGHHSKEAKEKIAASNWKGDNIGYAGLHTWVRRTLGTPQTCVFCHKFGKRKYHWSNISGKYKRRVDDWQRLCVPCHSKFDRSRNLT